MSFYRSFVRFVITKVVPHGIALEHIDSLTLFNRKFLKVPCFSNEELKFLKTLANYHMKALLP